MISFTVTESGPLFLAIDVLSALGYNIMSSANTSYVLSSHCPNSKKSKDYGVKPPKSRSNSVLLTLEEVLTLCSKSTFDSSKILEWLSSLGFEIKVVNNVRDEILFGDQCVEKLFSNYTIIRQHRVLEYRLDFYIPELNIAIEFDEEGHLTKQAQRLDIAREEAIKKEIGCLFIRVPKNKFKGLNYATVSNSLRTDQDQESSRMGNLDRRE